jgi:hypothetical protein
MGEERIRIESYDMPEGKCTRIASYVTDLENSKFPIIVKEILSFLQERWKCIKISCVPSIFTHFLYNSNTKRLYIDMKMKAIDFILNQNAEKLEDLAKKLK